MNYTKNIRQLDVLCCVDWHSQNQTVVFFSWLYTCYNTLLRFLTSRSHKLDRPSVAAEAIFFSFLISLVTCALTHPAAPVGAPFRTNKTKQKKKRNKNKRHFAVDVIRVCVYASAERLYSMCISPTRLPLSKR